MPLPSDLINIITFHETIDGTNTYKMVAPASIANWFADYVNLSVFRGSGLDVSNVTDFSGLFKGCINAANIDMTGWVMGASANISEMLGDCRSLKTITVSDTTRIAGAGLLNISSMNKANGVWERYDDKGKVKDPWFGTTDNLERRYNGTILGAAHGDATYRFNTILRGGRFDNDNTWWKFDNVNNILSIGADDDEDGETLGKLISETASANGTVTCRGSSRSMASPSSRYATWSRSRPITVPSLLTCPTGSRTS